jgi:uncharacterized membrane protein
MKRFFDWVNAILLLCMIGAASLVWPDLPDRIPVHFGIDGRPDGWAEKSLTSWFVLPGVAVALTFLMGAVRALLSRNPRWVNLPDRTRVSDLPAEAQGPVLEMISGFLALIQTELLVIFGLIQLASYRTATGGESQGIMILVLLLAVLTSPFLLVVFFLRLQGALDRGRKRARRAQAGVAGGDGFG